MMVAFQGIHSQNKVITWLNARREHGSNLQHVVFNWFLLM
jgi:hypothetical protein